MKNEKMTSELAAIQMLRDGAQAALDEKDWECQDTCKCGLCVLQHAMSATSGYADNKSKEGQH